MLSSTSRSRRPWEVAWRLGGGPEANASFKGEITHVKRAVNTIDRAELNAPFARLLQR